MYDVIIVGGGIIGLFSALYARKSGLNVAIVSTGKQNSYIAAGMLSFVEFFRDNESEYMIDLGMRSLSIYQDDNIYKYTTKDTLLLSANYNDHLELLSLYSQFKYLGIKFIDDEECYKREVYLKNNIMSGIYAQEGIIDNRLLLSSLVSNIKIYNDYVVDIFHNGVITKKYNFIKSRYVINTVANNKELKLRKIYGQIIRLISSKLIFKHIIRTVNSLNYRYIFNQSNNIVILGSTLEEQEIIAPTVDGVYSMFKDIINILPIVKELKIESIDYGSRVLSADMLPIFGEYKGVFISTGYYKHGILLAPLMGKNIINLILNKKLDIDTNRLSPYRFLN